MHPVRDEKSIRHRIIDISLTSVPKDDRFDIDSVSIPIHFSLGMLVSWKHPCLGSPPRLPPCILESSAAHLGRILYYKYPLLIQDSSSLNGSTLKNQVRNKSTLTSVEQNGRHLQSAQQAGIGRHLLQSLNGFLKYFLGCVTRIIMIFAYT
jgi:hypothetical protein